jgi:hypothetical protein
MEDKFKSKFTQYASVLNLGFTERDATPPNYEKRKKSSEKNTGRKLK